MVDEKTSGPHQHASRVAKVGEDKSILLWRVGAFTAAISAGLAVAGAHTRANFYDKIKNIPGFNELRVAAHNAYDTLSTEADMASHRSNAEKFKDYLLKRLDIHTHYTHEISALMEKRFGILSERFSPRIFQGTWQRFRLLGPNDRVDILIRSAITSGATIAGILMLRENNRLWNRLDEARQQQAQDRLDMKGLLRQVSENHSKLIDRSGLSMPDEDRREDIHANDNAANDNLTEHAKSKPRHQVHMDEAQHHDRLAHAGHAQQPNA